MSLSVGIVGVGLVGSTLRYGFRRLGHDVAIYDPRFPGTKLTDVLGTQLVFICVPTPPTYGGVCDTSIVQSAVAELESLNYRGLVVVKSTVIPGTTDELHLNHRLAIANCPEFLREKCSYSDFVENHDVCVIGAYRHIDFELIRLAHGYFPKKFVMMTPLEAEFCKYFVNTFNALRINFANQFYEVCKNMNVDYSVVKNAMALRQSIGPHYLDCAPNFRGFGGACLPKDTRAFAEFVKDLGIRAPIFEQIVDYNEAQPQGGTDVSGSSDYRRSVIRQIQPHDSSSAADGSGSHHRA
jgi:UDPglucose 6-dehydrogenase